MVIVVGGGFLTIVAAVSAAYHLGWRAGASEVEADALAGSTLSNALRVRSDVAIARALQSADSKSAISGIEQDMLLNAVLMGTGASPDSTDADTAGVAHMALVDLENYIHDHPSTVLTNRLARPMIQRSKEQIAEWLHALTNGPKRGPWGIAYDRKAVIPD